MSRNTVAGLRKKNKGKKRSPKKENHGWTTGEPFPASFIRAVPPNNIELAQGLEDNCPSECLFLRRFHVLVFEGNSLPCPDLLSNPVVTVGFLHNSPERGIRRQALAFPIPIGWICFPFNRTGLPPRILGNKKSLSCKLGSLKQQPR